MSAADTSLQRSAEPGPSVGGAWYIVLFLTLLLAFSLLDRMVLLLVVEPLRADLMMSDTQLGLLFGFGFGVVYAIAGVPLAHIVDNGPRVRVVVIGVLIWSLCTIGSGFAQTYTQLLLLRCGVAIGEAALTPVAISMIGDLFPPGRRTLPTTVYFSVSAPMTMGAFVIGGAALAFATSLSPAVGMVPWRLMMILVGVPGLLFVATLILTVKDPPRREDVEVQGLDFASPRETLRHVWAERNLWGLLYLSIALTGLANAGLVTWAVTLLTRAHGMTAVDAGYLYGTVGLVGAIAGTVFWPMATTFLERKGVRDAAISLLGVGLGLVVTAVIVAGAGGTPALIATGGFLSAFGTGAVAILPSLVVHSVAPSRLRARLVAGTFLPTYIIGLGFGPVLTALVAEKLFDGADALAKSMLSFGIATLPIVLLSMWTARKAYRTLTLRIAATAAS